MPRCTRSRTGSNAPCGCGTGPAGSPGCTRPAEFTDTDHIHPWSTGGKTTAVNLAALCRRHHLIKTHSAWQVQQASQGNRHITHWTGPLGTRHTTTAATYHRRD